MILRCAAIQALEGTERGAIPTKNDYIKIKGNFLIFVQSPLVYKQKYHFPFDGKWYQQRAREDSNSRPSDP